jgi:hypothetical protein
MYLNNADKLLGLEGGFKLYPGLACVTSSPRYRPMKCPVPVGFATNHAPVSMHEFGLHCIASVYMDGLATLNYTTCFVDYVG